MTELRDKQIHNSGIPGVDESAMPGVESKPEERQEWNLHVVDQVFKMAPRDGHQFQGSPFSRLGSIGSQNEGAVAPIVTKQQMFQTVDDVLKRKARKDSVITVMSWTDEQGHQRHVLCDHDREAMALGYLCEVCLQWQDTPLSNGERCAEWYCRAIRMFGNDESIEIRSGST